MAKGGRKYGLYLGVYVTASIQVFYCGGRKKKMDIWGQ